MSDILRQGKVYRRIGIIIDHPKRDLTGGVLLANAFGKHDAETVLIPMYDQALDIPFLGLDALIVNYARSANFELVWCYKKAGLPVWVLDNEGAVPAFDESISPGHLARYIKDSGYSKLLSGYLLWGSRLHEAFVKHSGMDSKYLHITGCPRFDIASRRWSGLLDHEQKDIMLINANFPLVNPLFVKSPEKEVMSLVATGRTRDYAEKLLHGTKRILEGFIDTVRNLAVQFPMESFIIRPHPFENADYYRIKLENIRNVSVDGRGNVLNVLNNTKCMLHVNCTTAIEAIMLKKLPLSLRYLDKDRIFPEDCLPFRVSISVFDERDLYNLLQNISASAGSFDFEKCYEELIYPWFYHNDGHAADRVAATVISSLDKASSKDSSFSIRQSLTGSRRRATVMQRIQALLANVIGSHATGRLRAFVSPSRFEKRLSESEIAALVNMVALHEGLKTFITSHARHPFTGTKLSSVIITPLI